MIIKGFLKLIDKISYFLFNIIYIIRQINNLFFTKFINDVELNFSQVLKIDDVDQDKIN